MIGAESAEEFAGCSVDEELVFVNEFTGKVGGRELEGVKGGADEGPETLPIGAMLASAGDSDVICPDSLG